MKHDILDLLVATCSAHIRAAPSHQSGSTRRSMASTYVQKHKLAQTIEKAITEALASQPENPYEALAAWFQSKAGEEPAGAVPALLLSKPGVTAPLDPGFSPVVLGKKQYREATKGCKDSISWALPRADGCAAASIKVFPTNHKDYDASVFLAGLMIQESIWRCAATSLQLAGPKAICEAIKADFEAGGKYAFEADVMPKACGTPDAGFPVTIVKASALMANKDTEQICGTDATGCRLSFDLGKSDVKTVAVHNNVVLYSKDTKWDVTNPDPDYHFKIICDELNKAKAAAVEQVPDFVCQAVGGSSTGTVSADSDATWCDIFPNVPPAVYKEKVVNIYKRIAKEVAGDVPVKVINDGEVTALAAVKKLNDDPEFTGSPGNILGISMGSSEGGGYANANGNLPGWINEMCYYRLDLNPYAPTDPWTKLNHTGISHMYLGQRGATKLAGKVVKGLAPNLQYPHPDMCTMQHTVHAEALEAIQAAMKDPAQKKKVSQIYETVGVYLGYGLAMYTEFYGIDHVMILGRVSKGEGGDLMMATAKKVLETDFPEIKIPQFHTADDEFKAKGQCIAAAALPTVA